MAAQARCRLRGQASRIAAAAAAAKAAGYRFRALTLREIACYKPVSCTDGIPAMAAKKPAPPAKAAAKAAPKAAPAGATDLPDRFADAQQRVKKLKDKPDNDTLLRLYSLYKQGSEGDVHGEKPGFFDFVGAAKYDAWAKLKGTSKDDAMKKYIALVDKLVQ